jgi:hypothetical protein
VDFEQVFKTLLGELERCQVRYAVIGGFAVAVLGLARATVDLDLLVHRDDLGRLHDILAGMGYQRLASTENVSRYVHSDAAWGSLDILHAFRKPSLQMLERTQALPIFAGTQTIRVVQPEDAIGLKVQAMANDPRRRTRELADIEALMELHGSTLDWDRIQTYFDLFGLSEEARQLTTRFGHAQ